MRKILRETVRDYERGTEGGIDCETHREREKERARPQISRVYGRLLRDKV